MSEAINIEVKVVGRSGEMVKKLCFDEEFELEEEDEGAVATLNAFA